MPWHVAKSAKCSPSKPWAVLKSADGSLVACHKSEYSAQQQLKALYANEPTARSEKSESWDSYRAAVVQLEMSSNGRTLSGLAIPYGQLAEIRDQRGHYQEMIQPGAFSEALSQTRPRMFFEHGLDVRTGLTPIGSFDQAWEESDGVHVKGQLFENELVKPLLDATRAGELAEWSAHFRTPSDGSWESWQKSKGWSIRTVNKALLPEISLVNKGAYRTTLSIRSALDELPDLTPLEQMESEQPANYAILQAARRARSRLAWLTRTPIKEHPEEDG